MKPLPLLLHLSSLSSRYYCKLLRQYILGGDGLTPRTELFSMIKRLNPNWTEPHIFRRQLYRSNVPNAKGTSTGVHYDQIFLRAGPPNALTAWVPIGDCPPQSGGLIYLENSKPLGEDMEREFDEKSRTKQLTDEERLSAFNVNVSEGSACKFCATRLMVRHVDVEAGYAVDGRGQVRSGRRGWQAMAHRGL